MVSIEQGPSQCCGFSVDDAQQCDGWHHHLRAQHRFGAMIVKMEAGSGMIKILIAGGLKMGRRDRDMLRSVGGIGDRTSIGGIII